MRRETINLTLQTYNLLKQIAERREETLDEAIMHLIRQREDDIDLAIGLDTVPSILNKGLEIVSDS